MTLPESVLIANRGEIAMRIIASCKRLGIRTIAAYSDADAQAMHVAQADDAVRIGPPPARESYLNQLAIFDAAHQTRAQAVHPGYGFLAENPDFADAIIAAGLLWIGPPPDAMRALGDKAHAKALAERHGVPVLAGYHGDDQSPETLQRQADRIGYPLLIKASAGGGGRGMRVVESADIFHESLEAAKREAKASFGDERVLLERYLARPRHVEIQILGDQHGHLLHLGERECSVQRRHQKLIEESPSPAVDAQLRQRMGDAALRLARAAGYTNAGTVEFLLDEEGGFSFLEVNARLQVEHPVTEKITGLDLVELQLRVAGGEPLTLSQSDVRRDGHAIEARVIAEDPLAGFLPSSGRLTRFEYPRDVRVDTWVHDGTTVSPYYDSLLAKVIAHRPTRVEAVKALAEALADTHIEGISDNVDLLLQTVELPSFVSGALHTRFLEDHHVLENLASVPPEALAAASAFDQLHALTADDPWRGGTNWRLGRVDQPAAWVYAGRIHRATVSSVLGGSGVEVEAGGQRVKVGQHDYLPVEDSNGWRVVRWAGRTYRFRRASPLTVEETSRDRGAAGAAGSLSAPMPARVVKLAIERGQRVTQNQPLIVLEAMKMEHVVEAPHAGVVSEVFVQVGQQVSSGERLLVVGSAD